MTLDLIRLVSENRLSTLLIVAGVICVAAFFFEKLGPLTPRPAARGIVLTIGVLLIVAGIAMRPTLSDGVVHFESNTRGKNKSTVVYAELLTADGDVIARGESRDTLFPRGKPASIVLQSVAKPEKPLRAQYSIRLRIVPNEPRPHDAWTFTASALLNWSDKTETRVNFGSKPMQLNHVHRLITLSQESYVAK